MSSHQLVPSLDGSVVCKTPTNEVQSPTQRTARRSIAVGLTLFVMSVIALAGFRYSATYSSHRAVTPLQCMSRFQQGLMLAFNSPAMARALADSSSKFNGTVEAVMKEVDTKDPKKMYMKALLKMSNNQDDWPTTILTLNAKPGMQQRLKSKLQKIWDGIVDLHCANAHASECEKTGKMVIFKAGRKSLHFGRGYFVFVIIKLPEGPTSEAADWKLAKAFRQHHPMFLAELSFGRTIQDMYNNANSNVATLAQGVKLKVGTAFASAVFVAIGWEATTPLDRFILKILNGVSKLKSRQELLYKHAEDLGAAFDGLPSFASQLEQLKQAILRGPRKITKHLKNLDKLSAGIVGVVVSGLPQQWEVVMEFKNFHPTKILSSILA